MKLIQPRLLLAVGALALALVPAARAVAPQLIITEVMSTGSSNPTYLADWFELTNIGASTVSIAGFKMDDNSHLFANSVALRGVTSIAAGQSVVFVEGDATGSNDATKQASFISAWFGGSAPAGFVIGGYGGTQVGLSGTADEVNIYDSGGSFVTGVGFSTGSPTASFDNHGSTNPGTGPTQNLISALSAVGQFGAFNSASVNPLTSALDIGSPGAIANAAAVPEPSACAALFGALALTGAAWTRRRISSAK